jgi:hypothetical protein
MASSPEHQGAAVAEDGGRSAFQPHYRAVLTGTIFAMSVLAYLGGHQTEIVAAVVTVVGTGLVIFFGEAYAGLLSAALASEQKLPRSEIARELGASSLAAGPGVIAALVLLLTSAVGLGVQVGVDVALWLGVLALTGCSIAEGRGSRRSAAARIASIAASVVVGVVIIVLKAKLH